MQAIPPGAGRRLLWAELRREDEVAWCPVLHPFLDACNVLTLLRFRPRFPGHDIGNAAPIGCSRDEPAGLVSAAVGRKTPPAPRRPRRRHARAAVNFYEGDHADFALDMLFVAILGGAWFHQWRQRRRTRAFLAWLWEHGEALRAAPGRVEFWVGSRWTCTRP